VLARNDEVWFGNDMTVTFGDELELLHVFLIPKIGGNF
jgi:predicted Rdx family selenoprotein